MLRVAHYTVACKCGENNVIQFNCNFEYFKTTKVLNFKSQAYDRIWTFTPDIISILSHIFYYMKQYAE